MMFPGIARPLTLALACLAGLSEAFATPKNLAKLAQRDGLDLSGLLGGLADIQKKKQDGIALNPLKGPIPGANDLV